MKEEYTQVEEQIEIKSSRNNKKTDDFFSKNFINAYERKVAYLEYMEEIKEQTKREKDRATKTELTTKYLEICYNMHKNILKNKIFFSEILETEEVKREFTDDDENTIFLNIEKLGIYISVDTLSRVINTQIPRFNPITNYFETLPPWDGNDYVKAYFDKLQIMNTEYYEQQLLLFRKWLRASYACVNLMKQNDVCLTLIGSQGIGKTVFLDNLFPKHKIDKEHSFIGKLNLANGIEKDIMLLLSTCWFINIDDQLDNIHSKDADILKNFISLDRIDVRAPYERRSKLLPRRASIMASVNNTNFLTDVQNRRYLCIEIFKPVNRDEFNIDMLWAQVFHEMKNATKESYAFTYEDFTIINTINDQFTQISLEMELIMKCFSLPGKDTFWNDTTFFTTTDIKSICEKYTKDRLSIRRIGMELRRLNVHRTTKRTEGFTYPVQGYLLKLNENIN